MAFADPQSVTIDGVAISLPRVGSGAGSGEFRANDGLKGLLVRHSTGKTNRRNIKLTFSKVAADPFVTGLNQKYTVSADFTVNVPPTGFTVAETKLVLDGFIAYLSASSGAALTKLLGGEN